MQATLAQRTNLESTDLLNAGEGQRGEQLRGSGGAVAPAVRHRLHLPLRVRQGVGNNEPVVVQPAHGEQMLGALPGGAEEVSTIRACPAIANAVATPAVPCE